MPEAPLEIVEQLPHVPRRQAAGETPKRRLNARLKAGLRLVFDLFSDCRHLGVARREATRRELHSPLGEVLHRWLADEGSEPVGERGAGHGHAARELVDGPRMGGSAVEETEPAADDIVAEACEPAPLSSARSDRRSVASAAPRSEAYSVAERT
jgi:hypothetical protein